MELNKIYCEDCLETLVRMPNGFLDLTVTSPPYDNLRGYNGYFFNFESIAMELFRVTKRGGVVVWIIGDATIDGSETGTSFKQALYFMECGFKLHDTMIYHRQSGNPPNKRYWQNFEYMFIFSKGDISTHNLIKDRKNKYTTMGGDNVRQKDGSMKSGNRGGIKFDEYGWRENIWYYGVGGGNMSKDKCVSNHPAVFPEDLAKDHIYSWSNEGDLVYDPFMGSGTTAKMAHIYKRNWIGSEISQEYVDLANKRLKPYLTQTTLF